MIKPHMNALNAYKAESDIFYHGCPYAQHRFRGEDMNFWSLRVCVTIDNSSHRYI